MNEQLNKKTKKKNNNRESLGVLKIILAISLIILMLYPCRAISFPQFARGLGLILSVSIASLFTGGIIGFLFGLPRTFSRASDRKNNDLIYINYQINTNLEQVSDWLTKILVGISLSKINAISLLFKDIGDAVSIASLDIICPSFASSIIVFYVIYGFLYGYLSTRICISNDLAYADFKLTTGIPAKWYMYFLSFDIPSMFEKSKTHIKYDMDLLEKWIEEHLLLDYKPDIQSKFNAIKEQLIIDIDSALEKLK